MTASPPAGLWWDNQGRSCVDMQHYFQSFARRGRRNRRDCKAVGRRWGSLCAVRRWACLPVRARATSLGCCSAGDCTTLAGQARRPRTEVDCRRARHAVAQRYCGSGPELLGLAAVDSAAGCRLQHMDYHPEDSSCSGAAAAETAATAATAATAGQRSMENTGPHSDSEPSRSGFPSAAMAHLPRTARR
jgi:hypothetical protein